MQQIYQPVALCHAHAKELQVNELLQKHTRLEFFRPMNPEPKFSKTENLDVLSNIGSYLEEFYSIFSIQNFHFLKKLLHVISVFFISRGICHQSYTFNPETSALL